MADLTVHYEIIKRPVFTEKGTAQQERKNTWAFEVHAGANKIEIKKAIEAIFGVKVMKVRTMNMAGKVKRLGYSQGRSPSWKKALVTIREGDTIQLA